MTSFPVNHGNMLMRKRPGLSDPVIHPQPLDLSIPRPKLTINQIKVRHHWSGGSIVEVNERISTPSVTSYVGCNGVKSTPMTLPFLKQQLSFHIQVPQQHPDSKFAQLSDSKPRNRVSKRMIDPVVENDLQRLSATQLHLRLSGYYYANLSRKEAIQILQHTPVGTFLLRDSSDSRCLYALSIQTEAGPTSVRIHYVDGDFRLDASSSCVASNLPRFRSVLELVDFYVSKWRSCKERGQVWLDNRGTMHSEIILKGPVIQNSPTLQHLCRLAWNRSSRSFRPGDVPHRIQSFLQEYPFRN